MAENTTILNITAKDQTKVAFDSVQANIDRMSRNGVRANTNVDRAARQSRQGLAQFSYQIQDISVQLQGGQSPFIVLAQQGSQIASIFGAGGAVFGAIVAVGAGIATALLPSLFDSTAALEKLNEETKKLADLTSVDATTGIMKLSEELLKLSQISNLAAKTMLSDQIRSAEAELKSANEKLISEAQAVVTQLDSLFDRGGRGRMAAGQRMAADRLAEQWGLDKSTILQVVESAKQALAGGTDEINAFVEQTLAIRQSSQGAGEGFLNLTSGLNETYSAAILANSELDTAKKILEDFDQALQNSTSSQDENNNSIENMISKLQYQALTFDMSASQIAVYDGILANANITQLTTIQQLAQEIEARQQNAESIKAQADAEEKLRKEREAAEEAARREDERATENMLRREERAVEDSYRRQQQAIETIQKEQTQAMSEPDRIAAEFDERIRNTYDALQLLGLMETEHADLLVRINQEKALAIAEHEKELYDKQMQLTQARFQAAGQLAGALAGVFEEGTAAQRAALAVQKGLAVGEAIMNMHRAISSANAAPWPTNAFAIAQAASTGLSAIAGIKAASFEGGGFTGYGARAGGIDGRGGMPAIVHPNETIIDHTMGGSPVNVNITIQANDTRGFDELLNKRRGMIASMVQSSLNNMGRSI